MLIILKANCNNTDIIVQTSAEKCDGGVLQHPGQGNAREETHVRNAHEDENTDPSKKHDFQQGNDIISVNIWSMKNRF